MRTTRMSSTSRMSRTSRCLLVLASLAVASALGAQQALQERPPQEQHAPGQPVQGQPLEVGSVVRVQPAAGARWQLGRVMTVAGDTLWLARLGSTGDRPARAIVAAREQARIEVSDDYDAVSSRRHRVILGLGVIGALGALAAPQDEWGTSPFFGFGVGVVAGIGAAELLYHRSWSPVRR